VARRCLWKTTANHRQPLPSSLPSPTASAAPAAHRRSCRQICGAR